ncbi:hypothetical protein LWF01_02830 [Saxibacter everestensis]|uniref:DUF222 domain-containing protein n=1 Tax=Saxibacter everestensis TaxID=2909229 RepID=A0ABY8QUX9_9MICO|nr:hypothetical protein LWF01_02830 [Brevibacteriaceae bacterium ZFBP1038]
MSGDEKARAEAWRSWAETQGIDLSRESVNPERLAFMGGWRARDLPARRSGTVSIEEVLEGWDVRDMDAIVRPDMARKMADAIREQLRTPEAVERVANVLHDADHGETLARHLDHCERPDGECDRAEVYRLDAGAVIDALIGDKT